VRAPPLQRTRVQDFRPVYGLRVAPTSSLPPEMRIGPVGGYPHFFGSVPEFTAENPQGSKRLAGVWSAATPPGL